MQACSLRLSRVVQQVLLRSNNRVTERDAADETFALVASSPSSCIIFTYHCTQLKLPLPIYHLQLLQGVNNKLSYLTKFSTKINRKENNKVVLDQRLGRGFVRVVLAVLVFRFPYLKGNNGTIIIWDHLGVCLSTGPRKQKFRRYLHNNRELSDSITDVEERKSTNCDFITYLDKK